MKKIEFVGIEVPENKKLVRTDMESGVLFTFEEKKEDLFFYGRDLCHGFDHSVSTTLDTFDDSEIEYIHPDIFIGTSFKIKGSETIYKINNTVGEDIEIFFISTISGEPIYIDKKINTVNENFKAGNWYKVNDELEQSEINTEVLCVPIKTDFKDIFGDTIYTILNINEKNNLEIIWRPISDENYNTCISVRSANEHFKSGRWVVVNENDNKKSQKQNLNIPIGTKFKFLYTSIVGEIISFIETTNSVVVDWGETKRPQFKIFSAHDVNYNFNNNIWIKI